MNSEQHNKLVLRVNFASFNKNSSNEVANAQKTAEEYLFLTIERLLTRRQTKKKDLSKNSIENYLKMKICKFKDFREEYRQIHPQGTLISNNFHVSCFFFIFFQFL